MSPTYERKFLRSILKRIDQGPSRVFAMKRAQLYVWLALIVATSLAFALSQHQSIYVTAFAFVTIGVAYTNLSFKVAAARAWPTLGRFINRQMIVDRLQELGP